MTLENFYRLKCLRERLMQIEAELVVIADDFRQDSALQTVGSIERQLADIDFKLATLPTLESPELVLAVSCAERTWKPGGNVVAFPLHNNNAG